MRRIQKITGVIRPMANRLSKPTRASRASLGPTLVAAVTTAAELASVTQPVLVYRSTVDHVVGPASMKVLTAALPGAEVRPLANSYHVATLDNDAPEIFDGTLAFIQKHSIGQQNG